MKTDLFAKPWLRLLWLLWLLAMLCAAMPARGFESHEHRKMSQLAFELTNAYVTQPSKQGSGVSKEAQAALNAIDPADYGMIVRCVDYLLYPERLFTYSWPAEGADLKPGSTINLPQLKDGSSKIAMPGPLKALCDKEGTLWLQASHNNYAHFQQDLLVSLRLWHLLAIQLGKDPDEHNYVAALITNAVADHYLQDLFAPGHIVTPRDKLTDLPATATHDLANRMGTLFKPKLSPELIEIVRFLCGAGNSSDQPTPTCNDDAPLPKLLRQRAEMHFDDIAFHARALFDDTPTLFRGDDHLFESAQNRQRLLMLAVQIRSILDVLQGTNHLKDLGFKSDIHKGTATVWTDFGRYEIDGSPRRFADVPGLLSESGSELAGAPPAGEAPTSGGWKYLCSLGGCEDRPYVLKSRAPIISISDQRESQSSGAFSARNLYTVELSTFNTPLDISSVTRDFASVVEVAPLVVGWANYQQGYRRGSGPTYRAAVTILETDVSIGPYARWLTYSPDSGVVRKLSYGLRVDSGFFGYFSFYVTGGVDYGFTSSGELQRGRVWAGGLRVGVPFTRLGDIVDTLLRRKGDK